MKKPTTPKVLDRFEIEPQGRFTSPMRPLILVISLLFIISGALSLTDPSLISFSGYHYLAFLGPIGLATLYLICGLSALAAVMWNRWWLAIPQQVILLVLTVGILNLAIDEHIVMANGLVVHVPWQQALVSGLSILLLTGFHLASLIMLARMKTEAYAIANSELERLAKSISHADHTKDMLESARDVNDTIAQEVITAKNLIEIGGFEGQAGTHLDAALKAAQGLIVRLQRQAGDDSRPTG